jgi:hypothetical protein
MRPGIIYPIFARVISRIFDKPFFLNICSVVLCYRGSAFYESFSLFLSPHVYIIIDCLFVSFSLSCPSLLEVILEVWKYFGKWDVPMNQTFYLEYSSSFHHLKKSHRPRSAAAVVTLLKCLARSSAECDGSTYGAKDEVFFLLAFCIQSSVVNYLLFFFLLFFYPYLYSYLGILV